MTALLAPRSAPDGTAFLRSLASRPSSTAAQAPAQALTVPDLVGFGGWARSGKDTAADVLATGYGHRLLAFGRYVAAVLADTNPLVEVGDTTERAAPLLARLGYEGAKQVPDFVRLLQDLGSAIKDRDPAFWARQVLADLPAGTPGVLTGVRSRAEVALIRAAGGVAIWVSRPGVGPRNGHKNELEVGPEDFDIVLRNDSTKQALPAALHAALRAQAAVRQ